MRAFHNKIGRFAVKKLKNLLEIDVARLSAFQNTFKPQQNNRIVQFFLVKIFKNLILDIFGAFVAAFEFFFFNVEYLYRLPINIVIFNNVKSSRLKLFQFAEAVWK